MQIKNDWILERRKRGTEKKVRFINAYHVSMYIMYYNRKWQNFLKNNIDKENSYSMHRHVRKGERPIFKLKPFYVYDENDD